MTKIATGKFCWFEYVSKDAQKAQGFFGELFNWGVQKVPMPDGAYDMISVGDRTIGGYLPTPEGVPPQAHWLTHLQVADARATAKQVESLGGKIMKQPFQVGEFGTMAVAIDPHGAAFALWQPAKAEPEPAPADNTFCWNELASVAPEKSVAFYTAIGGTTSKGQDMGPMGTYHVLSTGETPRAGIMKQMMPEQPHAWLPYVAVANADATAEKAKKLGGQVIVPPTDIPGVGRFAVLLDTQGAALGILKG
jgi:predicted enzyme related to lactoylglutathione lyase